MKNKFKRKLFALLNGNKLLFAISIIAAFLSTTAYGQDKLLSLKMENVTMEEVLEAIREKTVIDIFYQTNELPKDANISIDFRETSVKEILTQLLKGTDLEFVQVKNTYVIRPEKKKQELSNPENLTQTIKGKVLDYDTKVPLIGANIIIETTKEFKGDATDNEGSFRIENVPIGRHTLRASFLGYTDAVIPDIPVGSAKEVEVIIEMDESTQALNEIVVKVDKRKPANQMAMVSARSFTVEETRRYAGGLDDPSRMASAFAGVTVGNMEDNSIIVRGNSPKSVHWRIDGVEVLNPNHFAGQTTEGGGFVSLFGSQLLSNSDFLTGAFPAEYGDVLGCVFDMKLRQGNKDKREYTFQVGVMGAEMAAEGPFSKTSDASYLINYRYSTFQFVGPAIGMETAPKYQDLSFKVNFPTKKAGTFSFWGVGGLDDLKTDALTDSVKWEGEEDRIESKFQVNMGTMALNHRYPLSSKSFLNTTLSGSASEHNVKDKRFDDNMTFQPYERLFKSLGKYTITSNVTQKVSPKHTNRTGLTLNSYFYNIKYSGVTEDQKPDTYQSFFCEKKSNIRYYQFFTQSKFNLFSTVFLNVGVHSTHFALNKEWTVEPRAGVEWNIGSRHKLSFGYGNHSQLEEPHVYFSRYTDKNGVEGNNQKLKSTKAHHFVLGYSFSIDKNTTVKIEPYYQHLYDVPVIADSSFSLINYVNDYQIENKLINTGTGSNYGLELTLERFFYNNIYYLVTGSIFQSKYKGDDRVERNTKFNRRYIINGLFGKEFLVGKRRTNYLGLNGKLVFQGGDYRSPVDFEASNQQKQPVYDDSKPFSVQNKGSFMLDCSVTYKINKPKYSSTWAIQVKNVTASEYNTEIEYNYETDKLIVESDAVVVPSISYKIEF